MNRPPPDDDQTPKPAKPRAVRSQSAKPKPAQQQSSAPRRDPLIGRRIGRCKLEALVGVGKTARVYRAHYEALDDTVAVKILRTGVAHHQQLAERFHSEARAIAKVDNENVPKIYDVGVEDDLHYMVVELLEGEEILELIQREQQVEVMDALRVVRQAANGLRSAHALGLVHRDIKPQNLFLLEDGTVKVVDFGLAARVDEESERIGTPHYMAPEVCELGNAELASDIYALGIVLYHLLVGQPPYAGQDLRSIMRSHIKGLPLRPERARQGLPAKVGDLVRRLCKRDPLMRPSAEELIEELDRIGGEALESKDTLRRSRHLDRARQAAAEGGGSRRKTMGIAAIVLGLLGAGVAAVVLTAGDENRTPESSIADVYTDGPSTDTPPIIEEPEPTELDLAAAREAERAKQEQQERLAALEEEAARSLGYVEQWARENWRSLTDNEAVRTKYLSLYSRYRKTESGKEARRRAKGIKEATFHPHPDKAWSDPALIRETRERWQTLKPELETAVAQHDYEAALPKVPPPLSGGTQEDDAFAKELEFWRALLEDLLGFKRELPKAAMAMTKDKRTIQTPDGVVKLTKVTESAFETQVDSTTRSYAWTDLRPAAIADLAQRAFEGRSARDLLGLVAFCYAHGLKSAFYDAKLWLGATPGAVEVGPRVQAYADRLDRQGK